MSVQENFGKNVRRVREGKGWSQDKLSDETGLHRTYISGIERGVRNPTIKIAQTIADALGIELGTLFIQEREGSGSK